MSSDTKNIIMAIGQDDYAAEAEAKRAIEAHVPADYQQSAVETVDGIASNAEAQLASIRECIASIQTPPFLDPVKLTWWKGVTFLPGGGRGGKITDEVKDALERFADSLASSPLPENQFLVVTATTLLKTSVFAKRMIPIAELIDCSIPKSSRDRAAAALERLPALAKSAGISFAAGADLAFIAKTGPDTRTIVSELSKMRTYLGDEKRDVTTDDIAQITSAGGDEVELWVLTEALASRNMGRVLTTLRNFQGDSGWPIMVSTVVERWFRDLIVAKAGGAGDGSWAWRKKVSAAAGFTMIELRRARYRMIALREKLVSSQPTNEYVEMEILRTIKR